VRLFLIRHGQTPANVAGELDTAPPGASLTDLGRAQAEAVVGALAGENVVAVHASPLRRTQQSATPLARARGLAVEVTDGLEEVRAGDLEMRSDREAVETYLGCLATWMRGDLDRRMPGAQDGHGFLRRYDDAVRRLATGYAEDETVVAFSHGAAIRTFTALRARGVDIADISERRIRNTGAVLLEGDPAGGWRLAHWTAEPIGGVSLTDASAHDVTGDAAEEALAEAD
jgi:probable phosphoglycerate mutase